MIAQSIFWIKYSYKKHSFDLIIFRSCPHISSGKGWENYIEGQKLKADGDSFRLKLNTQEIFDDWSKNVQARNLGVSGRIFFIEQSRARTARGNVLKLKVRSFLIRKLWVQIFRLLDMMKAFNFCGGIIFFNRENQKAVNNCISFKNKESPIMTEVVLEFFY